VIEDGNECRDAPERQAACADQEMEGESGNMDHKPHVLGIDIETYSDVDLGKCGVYRYVEGDFHILLFAYAFDDEKVQVVDMACGEELPERVLTAIDDPDIIKVAWNAQFERTCIGHYLGRRLSPDSWRCSMVHAASLSLPLSLKEAAKALKTGEQKDRAGEALIRYFAVPCKATKANGGRTRNLPEHAMEDWQRFKSYCLQDVRTERDIRKRLENFPLLPHEWDFYHMDQRINDRGVLIDRKLVEQAIACDQMLTEEMTKKAYELTGLENPNSVSQLKEWLTERGIEVDSLGKKNVAAMIKDLDKNSVDGEALEMLKLRLQMAKSSVKKYQAAERCTCADGRARGLFQFSGAVRTQRWCLTGDHEILTPEGWLRLDAWKGGAILCWNAQSEAVSFQDAKALCFEYSGPMYTYTDKRIDQCSTPDHRMRVQRRYGEPWRDMTVKEMAKCRPCIPLNGYRYHRGCANPDWIRVLIMTQADGTYTSDGAVKFHFKKKRKIERCKSLLRKAEIPFVEHAYKDTTMIGIPARAVPLWLRQFRTKTFGFWLLDENPDIFFDELPNWDGSRPAPNSIQYSTTNKQNADIVQALAHMSGRCCSVVVREHRDHPEWKPAYYLNIWLTPSNCHEIKVKPVISEFTGKVYCAETTTGYFLVRRNGRVWVTGNSGRNIQLQNLPQNHISTLDEARELIKMGAFDMVESIYGNTPDILSQLIRTMLIAKPGCKFIVADFSAIEARVLAWLAGEKWRLEAFERGDDIYCASASQMFGVPVVKHGINGELRQKGKVAELACIAEGQPVLTNHGLIPIEKVTTDDLVWDGEEFVHHDGVVCRGVKDVITYDGLTATEDHLVWVCGKPGPIRFGEATASGAHLIQTGDGRTPIRLGEDHFPGEALVKELESLLCAYAVYWLRSHSVAGADQPDLRKIERLSALFTASSNSAMARSEADGSKAALHESEGSGIRQLWRTWDLLQLFFCPGSWFISHRHLRPSGQSTGYRPDQYERKLREGEYPLCHPAEKQPEQADNRVDKIRADLLALLLSGCDQEALLWGDAGRDYSGCRDGGVREAEELEADSRTVRVYDIRNAGRHHRFTVSGCLVHNCGYGGSVGALKSMGALDMGLHEDELQGLIDDWRSANPHIVQFWWDIEKAAIATIKDHQDHRVGRIGMEFSANTLWLQLPSGRRLAYIAPKLEVNRFGRIAITYEGLGQNNKWQRIETYSGKLVENITQATARDILAEAMWRFERAGIEVVGHVHDEAICEVQKDAWTVDDVCKLMNQNPVWADGVILNSAGYEGQYYFKD
jgi:hypothetical protein